MALEYDVIPTIIGILFLVIPAMLLGKLCAHFKISEIIGFVAAGVILGPFALGGLVPFFDRPLVVIDDVMLALWQISGIIILFSAGLHFTFHALVKAGYRSAIIGVMGVIVPFVLGYFISVLFGLDWTISVIIGATLSATSIAISVTILEELRKEKTKEGILLVNAAVIDDVIGLAVLSAVISIVTLNSLPSIDSIIFVTVEKIGFWFLILLASVFLLPKIVHGIAAALPSSLEERGTKEAAALGSAFGIAAIASSVGIHPIVGAFAAGMALTGSKLAAQVREFDGRLKVIVGPLFFGLIGAQVNLGQILEGDFIFFLALLAIAIFSKVVGCGLPAAIMLRNRISGMRVGYGMIARGEVAFITAGIGLAYGVLTEQVYSTLVAVIIATIFISPTLLRSSYKEKKNN